MALLQWTKEGLYCEKGKFFIDPWCPVERAVITHAHGDHARVGSRSYLAAKQSLSLLKVRLPGAKIEGISYGETVVVNGVAVSFHPAGHILGSAQVRLENRGEVCVVTGDYKLRDDPTCAPFEHVRCHQLVTEATFALPVYRWPDPRSVLEEINKWWEENEQLGRTSLLFAYSLGKAQRVLAGVDPSIGPIAVHGAIAPLINAYRQENVSLPKTFTINSNSIAQFRGQGLIIAPPLAQHTPWSKRFGEISTGFASGWMAIRGHRRKRGVDRGFILSDHADWDEIQKAIAMSGASQIMATHGNSDVLVRWLTDNGLDARALSTQYEGEEEEARDPL